MTSNFKLDPQAPKTASTKRLRLKQDNQLEKQWFWGPKFKSQPTLIPTDLNFVSNFYLFLLSNFIIHHQNLPS